MANTYSQQINPIRSQIWLAFKEQHTESGVKVTNSYGGQSQIRYMQLGDGTTSSTYPSMIGSKGFRFTGIEYITNVGSALTLGDAWSIGMMIRPKLYNDDNYLCSFSNGGGIIVNDSGESSELTYYDGTTTVSSGVVLERDRFYSVVVTKDALNNISFYINGELEGTGAGTDSGFTLDYIGCDDSLGNFYDGEIREFCVFDFEMASIQASILDERFIRVLEGQDFYWTPADDLGANGVWYSLTESGLLVKNTQPTIVNADMLSAAGWSPLQSAALSVEVFQGRQCLKVAYNGVNYPAASQRVGSGVIGGNRYRYVGGVHSTTADNASPYCGTTGPAKLGDNGAEVSAWVDIDNDATSTGTGAIELYCLQSGNVIARFSAISTLENLSVTTVTPKAATGSLVGANLVQASEALMPWFDATKGGVRCSADNFASNAAASVYKKLHDGTGGTLALVFESNLVASNYLCGTLASVADVGALLKQNTNGTITIYVGNGDGVSYSYTGTSSAAVSANTKTLVLVSVSASSGVSVRVNGASVLSGTLTSPSAANPTYTFRLGSTGSGYGPVDGVVYYEKFFSDTLSPSETSNLEAFFAAKHGITLP